MGFLLWQCDIDDDRRSRRLQGLLILVCSGALINERSRHSENECARTHFCASQKGDDETGSTVVSRHRVFWRELEQP